MTIERAADYPVLPYVSRDWRGIAVQIAAGLAALTREMSFVEHLEELRRRLIWSVVFIGAAFGLCWIGAGDLLEFASAPIRAATRGHAVAVAAAGHRRPARQGDAGRVALPVGAIRARPGVAVHLARPLSARAPVRGAVRAVRVRPVPGGRRVRLLHRLPDGAPLPAGVDRRVAPDADHRCQRVLDAASSRSSSPSACRFRFRRSCSSSAGLAW